MSDRTRTCISGVAVRCVTNSATLTKWWALLDSNQRSIRYERIALTTKLRARIWWGRKEFAPPQLSRRIYSPVGSLVPSFPLIGRSSRIRTYDLLVPNQAHYQAVLYSGSWWATLESNQACFSASNLQSDVTPCEHAARCWHRCRDLNPD